jgi:hypothetical protein
VVKHVSVGQPPFRLCRMHPNARQAEQVLGRRLERVMTGYELTICLTAREAAALREAGGSAILAEYLPNAHGLAQCASPSFALVGR